MLGAATSQQALYLLALLGLAQGAQLLSTRYYTSAAFERPILFSILTLILSGLGLRLFNRFGSASENHKQLQVIELPLSPKEENPGQHDDLESRFGVIRRTLDKARRVSGPFRNLLLCLISRTLLFWYTLRMSQCTWPGLEAFVPLFVLVLDKLVRVKSLSLPLTKSHRSSSRLATCCYAFASIAWAVSTISTLRLARPTTGTVCPAGRGYAPLTPYFQLAMCIIDAYILVTIWHIRSREDDQDRGVLPFLSTVFLIAAGCISVISVFPLIIESELLWMLRLTYVDVRDLILDSAIATVVLLCSISLSSILHPVSVTLLGTSLGLFGFLIPHLRPHSLFSYVSLRDLAKAAFPTGVWAGVLFLFPLYPEISYRAPRTTFLHRCLAIGYTGVIATCLGFAILSSSHSISASIDFVIQDLALSASRKAEEWVAQASTSDGLDAAVAEYSQRYRITPPPNFDKWHKFAIDRNSLVIDSFDQISNDLLPFWGLAPSLIRERTSHLLEYSSLEMGGMRIRNGSVQQSPHIPGTHRWMTDTIERMIEPFAQWLPDMDFAVNLGDECRVALPFEDKRLLRNEALQRIHRFSQQDGYHAQVIKDWPAVEVWPRDFPDPVGDFYQSDNFCDYFVNNLRKQLYYEWIAPTCPAGTKARSSRWWDRGTACTECARPHSIITEDGPIMTSDTEEGNLCYQPDLAYLDGFIMAPTVVSTKTLFPVFSQGRVGGFSDILFPSPWNFHGKSNYDSARDIPWEDKTNDLFWRGSSSDGYAWDDSWTGFVRARLVHESYMKTVNDQSLDPNLTDSTRANVSFTGGISKCHQADCAAELHAFTLWGSPVNPDTKPEGHEGPLPPLIPFEEHWQHRHLIDMDGAGFSGRFLPFLESNSLVYRAALFRTWFDERVRPWHHYVPVDVRFGKGFWSVLDYLAGRESDGEQVARKIADQGQEWAGKALRTEDMQIYMFRLLLEWGRIVDDEREHLGYNGHT